MTRRLPLFLSLFLFYVGVVFAAPVSFEKASEKALEFFAKQGLYTKSLRQNPITLKLYQAVPLYKTSMRAGTVQLEDQMSAETAFYIFNNETEGGYVFVAGDDELYPYIAYSNEGRFTFDNMPTYIRGFMDKLQVAVSVLLANPQNKTKSYPCSKRLNANHKSHVDPLLGKIVWDQGDPWNRRTPIENGKHTPVGCVATATAQIMKYHEWPESGSGIVDYQETNGRKHRVSLSSKYNWKIMPDSIGEDEKVSNEVAETLSTLCFHVGVAEHMNYSSHGSGTISQYVTAALRKYFKYDKSVRQVFREMVTQEQWEEMIRTELSNDRPVYYGGSGSGGGHAFVCDGYDERGLYHINWGWRGVSNAYFNLNLLDPENLGTGGGTGDGFSEGQEIIIGIQPDKDGTSKEHLPELVSNHFEINGESSEEMGVKIFLSTGAEESFDGQLTIAMKKVNSDKIVYSDKCLNNLHLGVYTFKKIDIKKAKLFDNVEDGKYVVYPVTKVANSDWYRLLTPVGKIGEVQVEFSDNGQSMTVLTTKVQRPNLSYVEHSTIEDLNSYSKSMISFTLKNDGDLEFYNNVVLKAIRGSQETDLYSERILVKSGESKQITLNIDQLPIAEGEVALSLQYKEDDYDRTFGASPSRKKINIPLGYKFYEVKKSNHIPVGFKLSLGGDVDPLSDTFIMNRKDIKLPKVLVKNIGTENSSKICLGFNIIYFNKDRTSGYIMDKDVNLDMIAAGEIVELQPFENNLPALEKLKSDDVDRFYLTVTGYYRYGEYNDIVFVGNNSFTFKMSDMDYSAGYNYFTLRTNKAIGDKISIAASDAGQSLSWIDLNNNGSFDPGEELDVTGRKTTYTIGSQDLKIYTEAKVLDVSGNQLTRLNLGNYYLTVLDCSNNELEKIDALYTNDKLNTLICYGNKIGNRMDRMVKDLNSSDMMKSFVPFDDRTQNEENKLSEEAYQKALGKHWGVFKINANGSKEVYVHESIKTFKVTLLPAENGRLAVTDLVNLSSVPEESTIYIQAIPDKGYELVSLTANGEDILKTKEVKVTSDIEIKAIFKKQVFKVELQSNEHGTIEVSGEQDLSSVLYGTKLKIMAKPNEDCKLTSLTANDNDILESMEVVIEENTIIKAVFSFFESFQNVELDQVKVYPNPTKDYVYVSNLKAGEHIYLFDMNGRLIKAIEIVADGVAKVDVSMLSTGSYLIKTNKSIVRFDIR